MNDIKKRNSEDKTVEKSAEYPFFSSLEQEREKKKNTLGIVVAIAVLTVFLMGAISSAVALNESSLRLADIKSEITSLQKQKNELESELEKKHDMVAFEQYAIQELGMLKGDETQNDDREDKIE